MSSHSLFAVSIYVLNMLFNILKAGALALVCASTTFATYVLEDDYSGETFFDTMRFVTVSFHDQSQAVCS